MKTKLKKLKTRNPLHGHPLLRKGGVHDKTAKALRKQDRQKLKQEWSALILILQVV